MKKKLTDLLKKPQNQLLLILGLTFACYFNSIFNDYSLDDQYITENQYVSKGISGLKDIWTHPYMEIEGINIDYRPITLSLLNIEFSIFGKHAFVSHLINLLLYLVSLLLLFRLSRDVFKLDKINPYLPFLALLLYSIHPSHTEVVDSLKNRDEILSYIFILLTAFSYQRSFEAGKAGATVLYIFLTSLFFYLSILTKLVCLPFMACLFAWSVYNGQYKKYLVYIPHILLCTGLFLLHLYIFQDYFNRAPNFYENPVIPGTDLTLRLGVSFNALLFYLKFLVIPFPSRFYYGYNVIPFESIANPMPLLSLLIFIGLVGLLIYSFIRKKEYSYFLFSFLFFLFFYSNLLITYTGIVSERAMFQFSFFFIVLILLLSLRIRKESAPEKNKPTSRSKGGILLFSLFLLFFSILTIKRNFEWNDFLSLNLHDMKYLKNSTYANHITAYNCYLKSQEVQKEDTAAARAWATLSVYYYKQSFEISPDIAKVYFYLGNVYRYGLNDLDNAEKNYVLADQKPKDKEIKGLARQLGSLYFLKKEFSKAIPYYDKAVKESPEDAELSFYRALNRFNAKDIPEFLALNADLQKKFPDTEYPYLNYATYYFNQNNIPKTIENFEAAVKYGSTSPQVFDFMITYFRSHNMPDKAAYYEQFYQKLHH